LFLRAQFKDGNVEKPEVDTSLLSLTPSAIGRVRSMLQERNLPEHALRVFVTGGGCSGLRYGMALEGAPADADAHYSFDGVHVVVDPYSFDYLRGATIDYVEDLMGGGFKIENPNAKKSCGCGQSFKPREGETHEHEHQHGHEHQGGGCSCG
jgi:iron-sulfur cluster assembly accessory protein